MRMKRWIACCMAAVLLCLSGCSAPQESSSGDRSTAPSYNPAVGQVRIFTCSKELEQAFKTVAVRFEKETGIHVVVSFAEDHSQGLQQAMDAENAPTLFCLHSQVDMEAWQESLYNLEGAEVLGKLADEAFALTLGDRKLAIAAHTQGYGLVYNASLLARVGFTRSDITSFTQLQQVSQYITQQDVAFSAFAAPDLTAAGHKDMACLLSGIGQTTEDLKAFWDLYIQNGHGDARGLAAFLDGNSVFCLGGTWDHQALQALGSTSLDILPAFTPAGGSLCYTVELGWGVNAAASKMDIQRTLEFLSWMATAGLDAPAPVDSLGLFAPFADAVSYENALEKKLREYMMGEAVAVTWHCCCGGLEEAALQSLNDALAAYTLEPTQENWDAAAALLKP